MARRGSFLSYVRAAFSWHWNLLAVGTGAVFAFLSGRPDMVLPILAAGEIAYLGLLSTHPRFRKSVDARLGSTNAGPPRQERLETILKNLSRKDLDRFEILRTHCLTLNRLGRQFRSLGADGGAGAGLNEMHMASLERLLWMFLKLLYSRDALARFLGNSDRLRLVSEIEAADSQLSQARNAGRRESLLRSYEDRLATMRERLKNHDMARDNFELIEAELERIEQKITAISETAMTSGDATLFTAQVDGIADSISVTTEAIRQLDVVPDMDYDDRAPTLLREPEVISHDR